MNITNQNITSRKKEILLHLTKKQIKDAILLLTKMAVNLQDWHISERLNEIDTTYKYMLHYQFEGVNDPEQKKVYSNILRTLYELTDDITEELLMSVSTSFYYEKSRINSLREKVDITDYQQQLKDLYSTLSLYDLLEEGIQKQTKIKETMVKRERIASDLFLSIYIMSRLNEESYNKLLAFVQDIEIREREKCLFISALTLSLFHKFDGRKVSLLMDLCKNENPMICQRAIVGLIITLQMYDIRWEYYPECQQQLESLSENSYFRKSVVTVIKQLIRSRETEKISKRMTEEIIPEMLRFNSLAGKKLNMEDLMGMTDDFSEKNPEWKKELENSGLADKLQEYSNLQMEGADVFHSTFAHLKSFPFFSDFSNWFLPFDITYSELLDLFNKPGKNNLLYNAILHSGHMCDSDKYSFSFSLLQMPESQREMMLTQFGAESEEIKQLQKEAMEINPEIQDEVISNQYIQDLYRFFKLYPARNNFFDIFRLRLNFYDKKSIVPLISDIKDMKQIASYCFDKNFLNEALHIYELIAEKDPADASVWQKIGYCRQMKDNYEEALDAYLQADLIMPNNSWTMKRIAQLYRSSKQPESALSYYIKLQELNPDNINIELNVGHCYLDMKEFDKALNAYFKVELLDGGDNPKAWRPIAWTAFLLKKFDLSRSYYRKIIEKKPTVHDYLNAGHVELATENKKEALSFYLQATHTLKDENINEFVNIFLDDKEEMESVGINTSIFPLIFDELRYKRD